VAAGTGNASIPAAKAGAQVTASDLTPELLDAGRARAESEGLTLEWVEADAEHPPFEVAVGIHMMFESIIERHAEEREEGGAAAG
jgi:ubiquinone/menaquinone biosynthesis C-methylase UbiE